MLHYSFNSIFEQVFVTGYQASLHNPSHIIHISYNVNGSLCVVQHNSPSLLHLWSGYASDFWPFLINIFALLFDTYRISASPSLLSHFKSFSWLNFQSFSKIFWQHYFVLSPLHSIWPYVFIHFKLCYWRWVGFGDESGSTLMFNPYV